MLTDTNTYKWLYAVFLFPTKDFACGQVDDAFKNFTPSSNAHHIRNTGWTRCVFRVFEPYHHLCFPGLPQCDGIEEDITVLLPDERYGCLNLKFAQRVEGMWRRDLSGKVGRCLLQSVESHDASLMLQQRRE